MKKNASQMNTLRRVLKYTAHSRGYIIISLLFAIVSVALTLYLPVLSGDAIDLLIGAGKVDFGALNRILVRMIFVILATALAQWLMSAANNRITYRTVRDIRADAFARLQRLPLSYLDAHPSGDIVSRVIADVDTFSDGLLMGFTQLFTGVLTILGTLLFMLRISVGTTVFVVLATPISLFVAAFIAKKTYTMFKLQTGTRGEQTALINEMIGGQKVVEAFGQEENVLEKFDAVNARLQKFSLRATFFSSLTNPCTRFVNSLVYAGVAVFGSLSAITSYSGITVGQLACFLTYANQYTKPFNEISGVVTELQNAIACAARIFELIDEPAEQPDAEDALELKHADGYVRLDDVSFSYRPDQHLIEHFNLSVTPGNRVAIVGPTGCGKTTLINLLMRFYDINDGQITVDDHDIRHITRKSLRGAYSMVLQDTWLFSGTIYENIAYARPDATREEVIEAAKAAKIHHYIMSLPQGYDTVITDDGANISKGQKQLMTIARAMLVNAHMLILDEATSNVDTRTEVQIQQAMRRLMRDKTCFVVAHRLSTIKNADLILVVRGGNVVESGTHRELMAKGGFYREMYDAQFH